MTLETTLLAALGSRLEERREAILADWRARVRADPLLATGDSLPVAQLNDHLTALLEDFERRLKAAGSGGSHAGDGARAGDAAAHGLHRWQQGYAISEVARELGRLNESMVGEIDRCCAEPGLSDPRLSSRARSLWASSLASTLGESAEQYAKLRQLEASGQVRDLEAALASLRGLESQRGALWEQAAHDLRGNLAVVALATRGLARAAGSEGAKDRLIASLDANVRSLGALLADVTTLARLQGGQEVRLAAPMDASALLRELAASAGEFARERGLELRVDGPERFDVDGDAIKVRRVVQNLLLNALRYTRRGSVALSWGADSQSPDARWFVQVRDTGPGLPAGSGPTLAAALGAASQQSKLAAEAESAGEVAHVGPGEASDAATPDAPGSAHPGGEGIGLLIVKRLCSLLDATLEMESSAGVGTTFRAILPRGY